MYWHLLDYNYFRLEYSVCLYTIHEAGLIIYSFTLFWKYFSHFTDVAKIYFVSAFHDGRQWAYAFPKIFCDQVKKLQKTERIRYTLQDKVGKDIKYLITGSRRVWPVSRRCFLLHGTWSYLHFSLGYMLSYTCLCICFLEYSYV
jgi:hypothetical protein